MCFTRYTSWKVLENLIKGICSDEVNYEGKGSGWTLHSVDGIMIRFSRYRSLIGSTFLPLPDSINKKHAVINPQNSLDNNCFQWAILARYVKGRNKFRIDNWYLNIQNKFNFEFIDFPAPIRQITKFEKKNPSVSVNIYGLNDAQEVYPLRVCEKEETTHFDLLFISNGEGMRHYCYIQSFSRLGRSPKIKNEHSAVKISRTH